ncbi:DUF1572 family protein [Geobacillus sp. C56-T3]|uniref:DUF1572 family protein n=1 Tax=Geobacillus sp. (strain C56-T3) TaxID=691437 RepID=UPI000A062935|nr:DUF1572 family protein [Geobacillus sp. C56-T3]
MSFQYNLVYIHRHIILIHRNGFLTFTVTAPPVAHHYSYHIRQIVYITKHLNADRWETLTIPKKRSRSALLPKKRAPVLMNEDGARFVGKGDIACSLLLHLKLQKQLVVVGEHVFS